MLKHAVTLVLAATVAISTGPPQDVFSVAGYPSAIACDPQGTVFVPGALNGFYYQILANLTLYTVPSYATSAFGAAIDLYGRLVISFEFPDNVNGALVRYNTDGSIEQSISPNYGEFLGIAIDSQANIFVGDASTNSVLKFGDAFTVLKNLSTQTDPIAVAIDFQDNIWVCNAYSNTVQKFGSNESLLGTFSVGNFPTNIAIDSMQNVWVVNNGDATISKLSNTGAYLGTYSTTSNGRGVAIDGSNRVYVTCAGPSQSSPSHYLDVFDVNGNKLDSYSVGAYPEGVAVDVFGNVWVVANMDNQVHRIPGIATPPPATFPLSPSSFGYYSIASDKFGSTWITINDLPPRILRINRFGVQTLFQTTSPYNTGVAVDYSTGNLFYVSQSGNIDYIDSNGNVIASNTTGRANTCVAVDASGNAYITCPDFDQVFFVEPVWNGTNYSLRVTNIDIIDGGTPVCVAVDSNGFAWVTDNTINWVYKILGTTVLTHYSTGNAPNGIAVDSSGNLWIANVGDSTIMKMSTSGTLLGTFTTTYPGYSIVIDGSDKIYVSCYGPPGSGGGNTVDIFDVIGSKLNSYAVGVNPTGLAIDIYGNLWVISEIYHMVRMFAEIATPPTALSTQSPSSSPSTMIPSISPSTVIPTSSPSSQAPSQSPISNPPTHSPSSSPTLSPSRSPSSSPTSKQPSQSPTRSPASSSPTSAPTTKRPSGSPTTSPTTRMPSQSPTHSPSSGAPSNSPTKSPVSLRPSHSPSRSPLSSFPSSSPTQTPLSQRPSQSPSLSPSRSPSRAPSASPISQPPSRSPTKSPKSQAPSTSPTKSPFSLAPSQSPASSGPSDSPSKSPSHASPSQSPMSTMPSRSPSSSPASRKPSAAPIAATPSRSPNTKTPTRSPSESPSRSPSLSPTTPSVAITSAPALQSAPVLLGANFDSSFAQVLVTFSKDTNTAGLALGQNVECDVLLSFAVQSCVGCLCGFVDLKTLVIQLSAQSTVVPGTQITLLPSKVYNMVAATSLDSHGTLNVGYSAAALPVPQVTIVGPSVLGPCTPSATLTALVSNTGGRAVSTNWTSSANASWWALGSTLPVIFAGPAAPKQVYFATVTNWLGATGSSNFSVSFSGAQYLTVQLSSPLALTVNAGSALDVSAMVQVPLMCALAAPVQFAYQWNLTTIGSSFVDVTELLTGSSMLSNRAQASPGALAPGSYQLSFLANATSLVSGARLSGTAMVQLTVQPVPVVAFVNVSSLVQAADGSSLVIDASKSCDPNVALPVCSSLGRTEFIASPSVLVNFACIDAQGSACIVQATSSPFTVGVLNLNATRSPYQVNVTATSLATLQAPASTLSVQISVYSVVPACPYIAASILPFPARVQVQADPSATLTFQGAASLGTQVAWSVVQGSSASLGLLLAPGTVSSQPNLILSSHLLVPGVAYDFRFTATSSCSQTYADVQFVTNSPPVGGALIVSPDNGFAGVTLFGLSASLFEDPEGDLPLQFRFLAIFTQASTTATLSDWSLSPLLSTLLGLGANGLNVTGIVLAKDSLGAVSNDRARFSVAVAQPAAPVNVTATLNAIQSQGGSVDDQVRALGSLAAIASSANANVTAVASFANQLVLLTQLATVAPAATPVVALSSMLAIVQASTVPTPLLTSAGGLLKTIIDATRIQVSSQTSIVDPEAQSHVPIYAGAQTVAAVDALLAAISAAANASSATATGRRALVASNYYYSTVAGPDPASVRSTLASMVDLVMTGAVAGSPPVVLSGVNVQLNMVRTTTSALLPTSVLVPGDDDDVAVSIDSAALADTGYTGPLTVVVARFVVNIDEALGIKGAVNYTKDPRAPNSSVQSFVALDFQLNTSLFLHPSNVSVPFIIEMPLNYSQVPKTNQSSLACGYWDIPYGGWSSVGCNVSNYKLPKNISDATGWIRCSCNHASDYAAWLAFEQDVQAVFTDDHFALITLMSQIIVIALLPGFLIVWLALMCWGRKRDLYDAHLVHLGTFVLLTANKIRLHQRQRRFFAALRSGVTLKTTTATEAQYAYYRPQKLQSQRWRNPIITFLKAMWFESGVFGLANRFDPYFERMQRASILLGIVVGNLFIACFFYQLQNAADVSVGFLVGRIVLGSLVVLIPIKLIVRVLFVLAVARQGSVMDRVVHIYRVLAFNDDVMPSGKTEAQRADAQLLSALKRMYAAQRRYLKLHALFQEKKLASQTMIQRAARLSVALANPVFENERSVAIRTKRSSKKVILEPGQDLEIELDVAKEHLEDMKQDFLTCVALSQEAWKHMPRQSFRHERTRRQRSALFKLAAVLAEPEEPHLRPIERGTWRLPHGFYYVAWALLFAYYILCLVYSAFWVLTRADVIGQQLNQSTGGDYTDADVATETDFILGVWLISAAFAILFTYLVTEPVLLSLRFILLPACLRRWGAQIERRIGERSKSTQLELGKSANFSALIQVVGHEVGAVAATAHEQTQWERLLIFVFDFISELINNIVP